jgi:hypothetical protein
MFDGYLLSFLSSYLTIPDIVRLTRSSLLFREPVLLETLERRIRSNCSVRISNKQILPLTGISDDGIFLFDNECTTVSCSYFGTPTNNHMCLCDSNELEFITPNKTICLDAPIAEMYHNYMDGNMVREYYDVSYIIKIYFDISQSELFINRISLEFVKPKTTFYTQFLNTFRNVKSFLV